MLVQTVHPGKTLSTLFALVRLGIFVVLNVPFQSVRLSEARLANFAREYFLLRMSLNVSGQTTLPLVQLSAFSAFERTIVGMQRLFMLLQRVFMGLRFVADFATKWSWIEMANQVIVPA